MHNPQLQPLDLFICIFVPHLYKYSKAGSLNGPFTSRWHHLSYLLWSTTLSGLAYGTYTYSTYKKPIEKNDERPQFCLVRIRRILGNWRIGAHGACRPSRQINLSRENCINLTPHITCYHLATQAEDDSN